ncbi:MAG TPA: GerMN domain-containing protein [Acidimicrobiales bacterium]|nr:GerMN domain-containing protein [Acidimicrobiales bacterium]
MPPGGSAGRRRAPARWLLAGATLSATALLAAACGMPYAASPRALGVPLPAQLTSPTVATPASVPPTVLHGGTLVSFYYVDGPLSLLAPYPQTVATHLKLQEILEILESGPSVGEGDAGATTAFPSGSDIRALAVVRGVAHIELDQLWEQAGLQAAVLELGQIVYTLLEAPALGLKAVQFYYNGTPIQVVNGDGGLVSGPVNVATYCVKAVGGCPKPAQRAPERR